MQLSKRRLLAGAAVLALFLFTAPVPASTPPDGSVTVPSATGQTVTHTWTGTILPGANATSNCAGVPAELSDRHSVSVTVPSGAYDSLKAVFTFRIEWDDSLNDEILTVADSSGTSIGSSDGGSNVETVVIENLPAGTYNVLACAFASAVPVDYRGTLEIRTTAADATLAPAPANGLEFAASVAADNQRDESEPLVEIDRAGNIYSCGPSGFSMAADYVQVSTDGGDSFHLLGTPPRGQAEGGGGGDCSIALSPNRNSRGNFDWAFSGLGALSGFATAISPNNGKSIATAGFDLTGGVTNKGGAADRQWQAFVSDTDVLLSYNHAQPRNTVVLRSTDKGLTYDVANAAIGAASPLFPGPMRYDDARDLVYFGWDDTGTLAGKSGDFINLSISRDKGRTWTMCRVDFVEGEVPGFVSADHDNAGNIYVAYGDSGAFHTYMKALPQANLDKCNAPAATTTAANGTDPGWGPRVQVDRGNVRTTVFPWLTAGGAPGNVAVTFAGTETNGDPNLGSFKASWNVYVNQSLNALSTDPLAPPTFSQVKATTHPFHYDSICLNGLGCDLAVPPGDRSMADFFAIDYNPVTKKLSVVFNRTNKLPNDAGGRVASTMAVTQSGGPTLDGASLTNTRPTLRASSADPTGDALSSYSHTAPAVVPPDPATANERAADFTSVSVGPEIDLVDGSAIADGGFTVTMRAADLSSAALLETLTRTGSQSLLWVFRFTNGHQDVAASARWNPVQGFTFGYNDYTTGASPCLGTAATTGEKCIVYPGDTPIQGHVDQTTGTIRLSVPRYLLRALQGGTGHLERPAEVAATVGSRFYDATGWSLGNTVSPIQDVQSFLYPFDSTPAMDFTLQEGASGGADAACKVNAGGSLGSGATEAKFSALVHATLKGSVAYRDKAAAVDFQSTAITSVACRGGKATIKGAGTEGGDRVTFTVEAVDGATDTFSIALSSGYSRGGTLSRGNVHVK